MGSLTLDALCDDDNVIIDYDIRGFNWILFGSYGDVVAHVAYIRHEYDDARTLYEIVSEGLQFISRMLQ